MPIPKSPLESTGGNCRWIGIQGIWETHAMERGWLALVLIAVSGLGCQETRFLSCRARDPRVESRSYDTHDPYPDESLGPETFSRPLTFQEPRTYDRYKFDYRNLQAARGTISPAQAYTSPNGINSAAGTVVTPAWQQPPRSGPVAFQPGNWGDPSPRYNVVPY